MKTTDADDPKQKPTHDDQSVPNNDDALPDDGGQTDKNGKNLWDPRFLAEVMRDFYKELAKAYVSMIRGFKDHQ